jgi:putative peptidoglycan lipid II flippase
LANRPITLRSRISSIDRDHVRIARSAMWVSAFVLLGKSAGAFKEMVIAWQYGVGTVVDAYQLTLTLITWIPATFVAVFSAVLIPALVRIRARGQHEFERFLGEAYAWTLIAGLALAALTWVLWPFAIDLMAGSLSIQTRVLARELMPGMLATAPLTLLICVHAARLQAAEKHVNTLLECVPALTLLILILLSGRGGNVEPLIWGTSLGFVLQLAWLTPLARRADHVSVKIRLSVSSSEWSVIWKSAGIFMFGQIVMSCVTPVDQYFVAHLGDGAVGKLGYANRVLALALSMGALAIGRATLPVFSAITGSGDRRRAYSIALKWTLFMFVGASAVMLAGLLASHSVVALLFQRGAFTADDTASVAELFRWGLLQVPFYFAVIVMVQLFASQGRFKEMALIAIANFVVKVLLDVWFVGWLGEKGVLLATAGMHATSLACYLTSARKQSINEAVDRT